MTKQGRVFADLIPDVYTADMHDAQKLFEVLTQVYTRQFDRKACIEETITEIVEDSLQSHTETVAYLASELSGPSEVLANGLTLYHNFVKMGMPKETALCLKIGVDIDLALDRVEGITSGSTALHLAVR